MPVSYPKAETPYGLKRPTQGFCFRQSATQVIASHRELWNVRFEFKTGNASAGAAFPSYPTEQASRGRLLKRTGFHRTRVSLE